MKKIAISLVLIFVLAIITAGVVLAGDYTGDLGTQNPSLPGNSGSGGASSESWYWKYKAQTGTRYMIRIKPAGSSSYTEVPMKYWINYIYKRQNGFWYKSALLFRDY